MTVRMSVNLSDEVAQGVKELADKNGLSITDLLRQAIATEKWVKSVTEKGSKILVEDPSGKVREVEFR